MAASNKSGNTTAVDRYRPALPTLEPVTVEGLVAWTYHRQRAHVAGRPVSDKALLRGGGSTATATVLRNGRLGASVQGSGFAALQLADSGVPPDADLVHALVSAARDLGASLLVLHGKGLSRPDWMPDARPRAEAVLNAKGVARVRYTPTGKPSHCDVDWVDHPDVVEAARFEWATWRAALARLHGQLQGVPLRRHRLLDTLPPAAPWAALGQDARGLPLHRKGRG